MDKKSDNDFRLLIKKIGDRNNKVKKIKSVS